MSSLVGGGTDITGAMDMFATFSCEPTLGPVSDRAPATGAT